MTRQAAQGTRRLRLLAHILGFSGANLVAATLTVWLLQALGRIEVRGWTVFAVGLLCLGVVLLTRGARLITLPLPPVGLQQALRNSGG
jgi:hypothetical protein